MTLTPDIPSPLLTLEGYARATGKTERTIRRWLAADELPGAFQDDQGRWSIPADAERTVTSGEVVTMTRQVTTPDIGPDAMPSFLTIEQAAQLLGISSYAIATHREYFDVVPFGANGSFVVPLATIKRIRG